MKTYSLDCKDMGMKCDFVATGESRDEVMKQMNEHMNEAHPKEAEKMAEEMSPEQIDEQMMEKIQETGDDEIDEMDEADNLKM